MTKKKRTSRRAKKTSPKSTPRKFAKLNWLSTNHLSSMLAIASFVLSLVVFWPRLSVERDEIFDPRKPFSTSFLVKNDGYGFCYPIQYSVLFKNVELIDGGKISNVGMSGFGERIIRLCPNKSSTISLEHFLAMPSNSIKTAEINISLNYKPTWVPQFLKHFFEDSFRFKVARKKNGDYIWQKYF
jgi:hypothetical protein